MSLAQPPEARSPIRASDADWRAIDWSRAERDNFSFFRRRSNEPDVLTRAIRRAALESRIRPATATALDFGCDGRELSMRLTKVFGSYVRVPLDGCEAADRYLRELRGGNGRPLFDVCLMSHVLPYVRDAEATMRALALRASIGAIGIAILLDSSGDQYEIGQLARMSDPSYTREHDHGQRFAAFLDAHRIPSTSSMVTSQVQVATPAELARVIAFFLGPVHRELLVEIAGCVPRREDGGYRLTSNHRVFRWRLRNFLPDRRGSAA